MLFIASGESLIKHYIRHGNSVLASVYRICRQSVVQGVALNDLVCCLVGKLQKSENIDTQAASFWNYKG